jgi:hypothetical protein
MPRLALLAAAFCAAALAACDQPAPRRPPPTRETAADAPAGPARERIERVRWNPEAGAFEMDGKPLATLKAWTFDGSTDGFTLAGGEAALADPAGLRLTNAAADAALRTPSGLDMDGDGYRLVIVRLTRIRAGGLWDGSLHYTTPAHGEAETFSARPVQGADPAVNETTVMVYDLSQAAAAEDWASSRIDQIRIDTDDVAGGEFLVREVAVAAKPAGMGTAATGVTPPGS